MLESFHNADVFDRLRSFSPKSLKAEVLQHTLSFSRPAKTSRGTLYDRKIWLLKIWDEENPSLFGIGEAAPIEGLSKESYAETDAALQAFSKNPHRWEQILYHENTQTPAVRFALEQAILDLIEGGKRTLFPSKFTSGNDVLLINGLIWMDHPERQWEKINEKLQEGFSTLKLKIGANAFEQDLKIIASIRSEFSPEVLSIRLDANGAYSPRLAMEILDDLAEFNIHSIEQPIAPGQTESMAELCRESPIPIALDEELIGIYNEDEQQALLEEILPQYLVIKPTLLGGFQSAEQWIRIAENLHCEWWVTSYLESNVGLNALAQWTYSLQNPIAHGLGTGEIYTMNIPSPLVREGEQLMLIPENPWKLPF
jgi:o-succinylbenzoate synthase